MTQGRFESRGVIDDVGALERIARGLGLSVSDLHDDLPVEVISTGIPMLAVPVKSLSVLGRCRVEAQVLSEAYQSVGAIGCYPFTLETMTGGAAAAHARLFAPDDNIPEDPGTGSAAGSLSGYLVNHGAIKAESRDGIYQFLIEQGDFMGRPCRISAEVKGSRGNVEEVRIGGPSVVVARGELSF
jgi:trans-2,3-dihydro-3-hydroxyanthranilate isomerase